MTKTPARYMAADDAELYGDAAAAIQADREAEDRAAAAPALTRTWVTAISERISGTASDGTRYAVQESIYGNWNGYKSGRVVERFSGHDNCEAGATAWLVARLTGGAK